MFFFDFPKGQKLKKNRLYQDIKRSSDWIISALNSSGYRADLTLDSLKEIDRFFAENIDDTSHTPKTGGLLSEKTGQRLFAIGSYIGEVMIKEFDGEWITDDNDKNGEINIAVKLSNGSIVWPVQRIMKRCQEGAENDIYYYAIACGRK